MYLRKYFLLLVGASSLLLSFYFVFPLCENFSYVNLVNSYQRIVFSIGNKKGKDDANSGKVLSWEVLNEPTIRVTERISIGTSGSSTSGSRTSGSSTSGSRTTPCPVVVKHNSSKLNKEEITYLTRKICSNLDACQDQTIGALRVDVKPIELGPLYQQHLSTVKHGGWWSPENCLEHHRTAIIIPFRNRDEHLPIFLRQLFPILRRQQLHHRVFVVEQDDNNPFNRGKLMNIGFTEALKIFPYTCFVFHDVDLIPENDKISYGCKHSPMHLSVAVDKFKYVLPYPDIFGGIEMFSTEDYKKINGFSNIFYSWGGEDDVLFSRVAENGMQIHRQSVKIARYTMLKHVSVDEGRTNNDRVMTWALMDKAKKLTQKDGVNSLKYRVKDIVLKQLFTLIKVDLEKEKENFFDV